MNDMTHRSTLVSSSDVNGTAVYGSDGEKIGSIDHLMIDKQSGNVSYAVMHFGGFLGMGEDEHPIPWRALDYDPRKGGFATTITEDQLKTAPRAETNWQHDRNWEKRTYDHWGVPYYW